MLEKPSIHIGKQIQFFRLKKGWSQDALAKKADVPYVTLTKIESGVIANPSFMTVAKLAQCLGVTFEELVFNRRVARSLVRFEARGEGVYLPAGTYSIDLSLSSNPLGCSSKVAQVIQQEVHHISRYPDPHHRELRCIVAQQEGIPEEMIIFGAGADGVIENIIRSFLNPGDQMIIPEVSFLDAAFVAQIVGAKPVYSPMTKELGIDFDDIKERLNPSVKAIFLCNPNNPTGQLASKDKILDLVASTEALVIIDEANIEFAGDSLIRNVKEFDNLIVIRTFSKAYGLAGMRIGYCVAQADLVYYLWRLHPPFVNTYLAQKAAVEALKDQPHVRRTREYVARERTFLMRELVERGFEIVPSEANCFLMRVTPLFESSPEFCQRLQRRDCVVVDGAHFRGLGQEYVRIAPQLHVNNVAFLEIVDAVLEK